MVLLEDCQGLLVMTHADRDRCVYIWAHNNSTFNFKQYYYMQQWLGSWKFRTIKFFLVKILTSQSFCVYKWKKFILIFDVLSTGYNGLLRESHYFFVLRFILSFTHVYVACDIEEHIKRNMLKYIMVLFC